MSPLSRYALLHAGALPWLKDPFEHEQEEPLREVMTVPLLEQLHREARGFALTAALAVGLVRPPPHAWFGRMITFAHRAMLVAHARCRGVNLHSSRHID